jgi:hypothetical protein
VKVYRRFGEICRLHPQCRRISQARNQREASFYLAYSWALELQAAWFSETYVGFQRTTRRCIPEDTTLHDHLSESLQFYIW